MKLSDIMSNAGLSRYAEVALILFFVVFLLIAARVFWPSRKNEVERDRLIPFDDDRQEQHPQGARR